MPKVGIWGATFVDSNRWYLDILVLSRGNMKGLALSPTCHVAVTIILQTFLSFFANLITRAIFPLSHFASFSLAQEDTGQAVMFGLWHWAESEIKHYFLLT